MDSITAPALESAFMAWESVLRTANVLRHDALARYNAGTTPTTVQILGALLPEHRDHVVDLVRIARTHRIPLYPISTGKNWGYGDARPVQDGCVIVDLSKMNRIIAIDAELGVVTLEPGVTQGQLHHHLEAAGLPYMVPVTGAGPRTSILGNALERGYGITPQSDHFLAVNWLEAVLPDGELYQTPLTGMGAETADKVFKWGVGPYLDGLFTQGAFGIVTQAAVTLVKKPEAVEIFYFQLASDGALETYTRCVRDLLEQLGSLVGGVNVMNAHRMLAMQIPYPGESGDEVLSDGQIRRLMQQHTIPCWFGAGSLYGSRHMIKAARTVVRQCLAPVDKRIRFVSRRTVDAGLWATQYFPSGVVGQLRARLRRAQAHLDIVEGRPSEVALPLAYWRADVPKPAANLDPARDGCGLLWYAPLVPMQDHTVREAVAMVRRVCLEHRIEPLMTLTSLSSRCFDLTVPIVFAQKNAAQTARARRCFDDLFAQGQQIGIAPYRVGIEAMSSLVRPSPYWQLVAALKAAVDPDRIMAPGRYSPEPNHGRTCTDGE